MRPFSTAISIFGLVATLTPALANAQQPGKGDNFFDLQPRLTQEEFAVFVADIGSLLRFRQLGDGTTLEKGTIDLGVQFATAPLAASHSLSQSSSSPRIVGRFGVSDRVDVGVWGGLNPNANYGMAGFDTKILLMRQGPGRPVSVSVRPSVTALIGPSEVWAASLGVDLAVSRAFGAFSPYAGIAATSTAAIERSKDVDLDPATAGASVAYAGLSYRWRALVVSGEVENGTRVSYAFRVGSRF